MQEKYKGTLFNNNKQNNIDNSTNINTSVDVEKLIAIQAELMVKKYNSVCFDVKQLQEILNVGESNVYELIKTKGFPVKKIGNRKIVPAVALARYLIVNSL